MSAVQVCASTCRSGHTDDHEFSREVSQPDAISFDIDLYNFFSTINLIHADCISVASGSVCKRTIDEHLLIFRQNMGV